MAILDIGDHLMSLSESNRMQEKETELKHEVIQLQSKAENLKKRREELKKDLIRNVKDNKTDSRRYLQPIKVSTKAGPVIV